MASMGMVGAAAAVVARRMEEQKRLEAEKKKLPGVTHKGMLEELYLPKPKGK